MPDGYPKPGPGAPIREYSVDQLLDQLNKPNTDRDQMLRELARRGPQGGKR